MSIIPDNPRYLANDMQFFLTTPFIIFAMWKNDRLGLGLLATLLVIFTAIPTALGFINDWGFSTIIPAGGTIVTAKTNYMEDFYVVPWCR
jgi:hypothetical protein